MLAKYSIRAKITAVVALLLFAMAGMGLLAVRNMRAINANAVDIQTNWLPSVRILGELRASGITFRNVVREHMLSGTAEGKAAMDKLLVANAEASAKTRKTYESYITSPEERALYNEWAQTWDSYTAATQQVLALSRKNPETFSREAADLNFKSVNPLAVKADLVLQKDIELNDKGADAAGKEAAVNYDSAFWLIVVILGISVVIGVGVGIYLIRDVSRGIASIVEPMQALGHGDLTAQVPHQGETTEIGSMADSLQLFKQALIAKKAADEAASVDAQAKIERGHRVDTITRDFESMIGEIVETVSSASTRLEASAGTLSSTARAFAAIDHRGGRGLGRSLHQRAVRSPPRPRRWLPPSTRSVARCRNRRGWPTKPSIRPARPTTASASCRRRRPGSATWSN